MIYLLYAILQILSACFDLFLSPALLGPFFWIDLSFPFCLGGIYLFQDKALFVSIPCLLFKLSYFPSSLQLLYSLFYAGCILLFYFLRKRIQVSQKTLFLLLSIISYGILLKVLSSHYQFISFFSVFVTESLLIIFVVYSTVLLLQNSYMRSISKKTPVL